MGDIFSLCHGNALCVLVSGELGVLCVVAGVVKCVTCRFGSRACKHVEHVRKIFSTDDSLSPAFHFQVVVLLQNVKLSTVC